MIILNIITSLMVNSTLSFCKTYARSLILFLLEEIYIYDREYQSDNLCASYRKEEEKRVERRRLDGMERDEGVGELCDVHNLCGFTAN